MGTLTTYYQASGQHSRDLLECQNNDRSVARKRERERKKEKRRRVRKPVQLGLKLLKRSSQTKRAAVEERKQQGPPELNSMQQGRSRR